MSGYARDLRRQLEVSLQPQRSKANPLLTIGFSSGLLRLGLSEEQLYKYVRRTARALLAQMHPDLVPSNEIVEEQRRVAEAFELLEDRRTFSQWLRAFREEVDAERAEAGTLRRDNQDLRNLYVQSRKAEAKAIRAVRRAERDRARMRGNFEHYLLTRARTLRSENVFSVEQPLVVRVMRFSFYSTKEYLLRRQDRPWEVFFPARGFDIGALAGVPGAPTEEASLATTLISFRHLIACRTVPPMVGVAFEEFQTVHAHYVEATRHPKGERIILGTVRAVELESLRLRMGPNSMIPHRELPLILRGEVYPGLVLVTDAVETRTLRGNAAFNMVDRLRRGFYRNGDPAAFITDIVVDVHPSEPP